MDRLELPPTGVIDTKVCTPTDPNGTKSRIYTQSVSAPRTPLVRDEGSLIQFKSAKAKFNFGTVAEGDASIDANGEVDWNGKAKTPEEGEEKGKKKGKKIKIKLEANVEVCVMPRNGTKDGKGSWFTYEVQGFGFYNRAGHPDGDFCIGAGSDYIKPEGSIETP